MFILNSFRAEILAIINFRGINYYGTYFCDFGFKLQKFDPQYSLDESIAKTSYANYGLKANRKNKFRIFFQKF